MMNAVRGARVAIVGAAGRAGRVAALLLRSSPWVAQLALYDRLRASGLVHSFARALTRDAPGHASVQAYAGRQQLGEALQGSQVVLVLSAHDGITQVSTENIFQLNAPIVQLTASTAATAAPEALLVVVAPPVNRTLPLAAEAMVEAQHPSPYVHALGKAPAVESAASVLAARVAALDPRSVRVPLIAGACHRTAVPLLSAAQPPDALNLSENAAESLRDKIRAECEGGATSRRPPVAEGCSVAYLAERLARARLGDAPLITCALVRSMVLPDTPYFGSLVQIGPQGVEKNLGLPRMSSPELELLDVALPQLCEDVETAKDYLQCQTSEQYYSPVPPPPELPVEKSEH